MSNLEEQLAAALQEAAERPSDPNEKALAGRGVYRVHVGKALLAMWRIAKAAVGLKLATLSGDGSSAINLAADLATASLAAISAIREPLNPLQFLACVALSAHPNSTSAQLREHLEFFTTQVPAKLFPWYYGISESYLSSAAEGLEDPRGVDDALASLKDKRLAAATNGQWIFTDKSIEVRIY